MQVIFESIGPRRQFHPPLEGEGRHAIERREMRDGVG
jgi:hypothetical protein